ncbi:MAG: hypothetical protein ABI672_05320 [Vicinamibacteria bacterium]
MAVGPVRALLVARAQATVAQLRREGGGAGVIAAGIPALVGAFAIGPPAAMCFMLGVRLGADLNDPALVDFSARALSLTIAAVVLAIGVGGGAARPSDGMTSEALRVYPVPRRALLAAQLLSGAVGLLPALGLSAIAALTGGLIRGSQAPVLVTTAIGLQIALWLLLTQEATATFVRLVLAGRQGLRLAASVVVVGATVVLLWPVDWAVASLANLARGRDSVAWAQFAAFAASSVAAFGLLVALISAVDRMQLAARTRGATTNEWTPESPVDGVSRLLLDSIRGSRVARYFLMNGLIIGVALAITLKVLPLERLVVRATGGPFEGAARALAYGPFTAMVIVSTAFMTAPLWLNQFGWYDGGPRRLFLLPLSLRDVLLGHRRTFARALVVQVLLAALPMAWVRPPSAADLLWSLVTVGSLFFVIVGVVGPLVSVQFPRRVTKDAVQSADSMSESLVQAAMTLTLGLTIMAVYVIAKAAAGPWGPAFAMSVVLALSALYARGMQELVVSRVFAQRERLIEDLG